MKCGHCSQYMDHWQACKAKLEDLEHRLGKKDEVIANQAIKIARLEDRLAALPPAKGQWIVEDPIQMKDGKPGLRTAEMRGAI